MGISFVKELFTGFSTAPSASHGPRGTSYKNEVPFDTRLAESSNIRAIYPDRLPVIVEISESSTNIPDLNKKKYLVPKDITMGHLISVVRSRINLGPDFAIFAFVNEQVICLSTQINAVYNDHKYKDGFLYVLLTSENTFG